MKKILCMICLLMIVLFVGCSIQSDYPQEGVWYCEDLQMTLNMEQNIATYLDDAGAYEEAEIFVDFSNNIYIQRPTEDGLDFDMILRATFRYKNDVFYLTDVDTDHKYAFVRLTDAAAE